METISTESKNFIEQEIEKDLREGVYDHIPPFTHASRRSRTVICTSVMLNPFF